MRHAGVVIKELRKSKEMTQEQLAELLGVQKSSIYKYESGDVRNLKLSTIRNLCMIFQVAPGVFVFPEIWEAAMPKSETIQENLNAISTYVNLSDEGKTKILEYMRDIIEIPKYRNTVEFPDLNNMRAFVWALQCKMLNEHCGISEND